jgi:hypothetical protein
MFDNVTRTIEAWKCDGRSIDTVADKARSRAPQLRLQVLEDASDALMVEVAQGTVDARDLLYLQDRGVFEIAATLRRQSVGGARLYLRLRAWRRSARTARTAA